MRLLLRLMKSRPLMNKDLLAGRYDMLTWFKPSEFRACSPQCRIEDMDISFLERLDMLRNLCGFPLTLTCAFRAREYDLRKGRTGNSYHCKGRAVDIYCEDSSKRAVIVKEAMRIGLNGVGIGKNYVHVDDRDILTMWHYYA